ncbi:hypothetical protein [Paraburkholderia sp. DGU8]|uniref:hypothetical protein n=1 Tax=Paraburkholderia sp. DGU8 TaxID=3161997 RepID=UPI0034672FC0
MKSTAILLALSAAGAIISTSAMASSINLNIGSPAPVVVAPPPHGEMPGWHGERYWDGHRYWQRREWEEHQRHDDRDHGRGMSRHCPPGHAKHGEC